MISIRKYFVLFCATLMLGSCGATGRLLGNITMIPVHAAKGVARAATYQDDLTSGPVDTLVTGIEDAALHQSGY